MDAIRSGIQLETDAVAAYQAAREKAVTPACRELFETLIEFEEGHLTYLTSLYDELEGSGSWIAYQRVRGKRRVERSARTEHALLPDITDHALREERATLAAAIEAEQKAYDLYKQAAEDAQDPAGHASFQFLAQEEEDHARWLRRMLEGLPD
jgi:rubrerythrin